MSSEVDTPARIFKDAMIMIYHVLRALTASVYRFFSGGELKSIKGDIVLITGSGGEIGRQLSLVLSKLGGILVLWDINTARNEETAALIKANGGECYSFTVDVRCVYIYVIHVFTYAEYVHM